MEKVKEKFELWMASKGYTELGWNGKRYDKPRIQNQWVAFRAGWLMGENQL